MPQNDTLQATHGRTPLLLRPRPATQGQASFQQFGKSGYFFSPFTNPAAHRIFRILPVALPAVVIGLLFLLILFLYFNETDGPNQDIILDWLAGDLTRPASVSFIRFENEAGERVSFGSDGRVGWSPNFLEEGDWYPVEPERVTFRESGEGYITFELYYPEGYRVRPIDVREEVLIVRESGLRPFGAPEKRDIEHTGLVLDQWAGLYGDEKPWKTIVDYGQVSMELAIWSYLLVPWLMAMLAMGILYYRFTGSAPKQLYSLEASGRLNAKAGLASGAYVAEFERMLTGRWKWIVASLITVILFIVIGRIVILNRALLLELAFRSPAHIAFYLTVLLSIILLIPALGMMFWVCIAVGRQVASLTKKFDVLLDPEHWDRCAGMKPAGNICLSMAMLVIIPGLLFISWFLLGILTDLGGSFVQAVYMAIAVLVGFALAAFVMPARNLHQLMVEERDKYRLAAAEANAAVRLQIARMEPKKPIDPRRFEELARQKEYVEKIYPRVPRYPTWPFDTQMWLSVAVGILAQLAAPIVISFLTETL